MDVQECAAKYLQRSGAQDRRIVRYGRVVQDLVARRSHHRVDLQFCPLFFFHNVHGHLNVKDIP